MKRKKNLYDKIVDLKKIQEIYQKRIRINTKNKAKLEVFEDHYTSNITYIKLLLEQRKYVPRRYHIFLVKEPKIRLIMSQDIIDKIINHMVSKYILVDIFDKVLINENIATREGRGTHYGIHLLKKYLNEIKEYDQFYILKFDIKKYFYNLDHEIIKKQISKKIKDKEALKILYDIIDSTDEPYINQNIETLKKRELLKLEKKQFIENKEYLKKQIEEIPYYRKGKGLPIGNMSSQVLAILYLNELDHFIKEKLKIKYYIRYMDDGIILNENKEYLEYCLKEIKKIIYKYQLELNQKTKIYSSKEGFEFLGFRYVIKNNKVIMKVKNQTKKRFKRKMKKFQKLYEQDKITKNEVLQVKNSYIGHLNYGNSKKLIQQNTQLKKQVIIHKLTLEHNEIKEETHILEYNSF